MALPTSREWLDWLLESHEPTDAELRQIVRDCPREDQWIEYKAGAVLGQDDPPALIREYASGFANADGGALVVGYRHDVGTFDGARAPGGGSLKDWASRALTPIRTGSTLPEPRFAVTPIDGVEVLLVSVGRARIPVADIRSRVPVFFVRMGDQTLEMPHWLVTDLLLGRRAQPNLRLVDVTVEIVNVARLFCQRVEGLDVALKVTYENEALILAEHVRAGLVGWAAVPPTTLPRQLERRIQVEPPPEDLIVGGPDAWRGWGITHAFPNYGVAPPLVDALVVEPFAFSSDLLRAWRLPVFKRCDPQQTEPEGPAHANVAVEMKAALYLLAKNAEPSWWQLTLRYNDEAARQLTERTVHHLRFESCLYSRPVVSLRFLDEGEPVEF